MAVIDEAKQEVTHPIPETKPKRDRRHINVRILILCLPGAIKTHIEEDHDRYYTTDAGKRYIYHAEQLSI